MSMPNATEARRRFKERHGHYPGEGPVAGVTAEQQKLILEAIQSRDRAAATATAPAYSGKGYMELVEEYKEKRRCGIMEAMIAVSKKHPEARADYIRRHNPHLAE